MRSPSHGLGITVMVLALAMTTPAARATTLDIVDDQYFRITRDIQCATGTETAKDTVYLLGMDRNLTEIPSEEPGNTELQDQLDALCYDHGLNWIRVWTHWGYGNQWLDPTNPANWDKIFAVTDPDGNCDPSTVYERNMGRLRKVIQECDDRGMIVDLTFARQQPADWGWPFPSTHAQHLQCIHTVCDSLIQWRGDPSDPRDYENMYFDVDNEGWDNDGAGGFLAIEPWEIGELVGEVKGHDADWLCTCSFGWEDTPGWIEERIDPNQGNNDFITPHLPRHPDSPESTIVKVRLMRTWMAEEPGLFRVPIHLQEPFNHTNIAYEWDEFGNPTAWWLPDESEFYQDCTGGKVGGAAGWNFRPGYKDAGCYHLYDLDDVESDVLSGLLTQLGSVYAYAHRYQAEYPEQLDYPDGSYSLGVQDLNQWSWLLQGDFSLYLNEGPQEDMLHPGQHEAIWVMRKGGFVMPPGNPEMVTIEILDNETPLSSQILHWNDFPQASTWYDFRLPTFTVGTGAHEFDFRIKWHADYQYRRKVLWLDYVDVVRTLSVGITGPSSVPAEDWAVWHADPGGGSGMYTYQWYSRRYTLNPPPFEPILGETNQILEWQMPTYSVQLRVAIHDQFYQADSASATKVVYATRGRAAPGLPGPSDYALDLAEPNPFATTTNIRYQIPEPGRVSLIIYDVRGREVARLVDREPKQPGYYCVSWEPKSLSAGLYTYRLNAGDLVDTKRLVFTGSK
jgi:hypothetical protein